MKKKLQQTTQKYKGPWDYHEQLYANKTGQPGRNRQILRNVQALKTDQNEIENRNRLITRNEIESIIKNSQLTNI